MSQIFYESDNLTIIGGYGKLVGACSNGGAETKNENGVVSQKTIRLHFTIHVNGKLKTFFQEYHLAKSKEFGLAGEESEELTLSNYDSWYSVIDILRSMGYADDLKPFMIKEWCQGAISE